jgi:Ca2+-binding RTX toxin-like protein
MSRNGANRFSPQVEKLEDRWLMSAGVTLNASAKVLTIQGSDDNDVVVVRQQGNRIVVTLQSAGHSAEVHSFNRAQVKNILFHGGGGDDFFINATAVNSQAFGEAGDDSLIGGRGRNVLDGGDGNDTIIGGRNNDVLLGEAGDDRIFSGRGRNVIAGGGGHDDVHETGTHDLFEDRGADDTLEHAGGGESGSGGSSGHDDSGHGGHG